MLMRIFDDQGMLLGEVNDHEVSISFNRAERVQIGDNLYTIDMVGKVELDSERDIVFRQVQLRPVAPAI